MATPRPWAFDAKSEEIWSPGKGLVATVKQRGPLVKVASDYRLLETEANGELIVRAVNSHSRLVEALENALNGIHAALVDVRAARRRGNIDPGLEAAEYNLSHLTNDVVAALALARGEVVVA